MKSHASKILFLLAAAGATACGASGNPAAAAGGKADECSARQSAARDAVSGVIEANQSCSQDADCIVVSLGAGCFDSCSRVMAAAGKAAYEAAVSNANAKYCSEYDKGGCPPVTHPPCAPPQPPSCSAGKCH